MILCATDFSPSSAAAMRLAAWLAGRFDVPLLLVHVVEPVPAMTGALGIPTDWVLSMSDVARSQLGQAADELKKTGLRVETRALVGDAASMILETAKEVAARFIVMGTHGRKGAARLFLGSVAERVSTHAGCPVLVARAPAAEEPRWPTTGPLQLAIATDGSALGQAALQWARDLSVVVPCEVTVIRVYSPPREAARYGIDDPWLGRPGRADLLRLLERDIRAEVKTVAPGIDCRLRLVSAIANPAEALAEELVLLQPDAVVVGVSQHRFRWTDLPSAAVLRTSPVPVICVSGDARPALTIPEVRAVLVPTDLSEPATEALLTAYGLLRPHGGRVELCTVHDHGPRVEGLDLPMPLPLDDKRRAEVEAQLRSMVPWSADAMGIVTRVSVIEGHRAAESIIQAAERLGVDLIVMASHGRTGIKRALLGSVSEEVVRHARQPVMLIVRARS